MYKRIISMLLILVLLTGAMSFADGETWLTEEDTELIFEDVNQGDWFYEAVMTMNRYGIISGYPDGTFKPKNPVHREEFAAMMVQALKLEVKATKTSFADVADGYWASEYIETSKPYMTAWIKNGEYIFKPTENAVREDMAVALVRALDKPVDDSMYSVFDEFEDADEISENLKKYMAGAIYYNLMSGYEVDGLKYIRPMATLTRAEAAALLLSVVKEEKIVFDVEEKIVLEEGEFVLSSEAVDGGVKLLWSYETDQNISGYKVVASKLDSTPNYDENGYTTYTQNTKHTIYNNDGYNDGDFTNFEAGETYYVAITAIVGEEHITSNVIEVTMPMAVNVEGKVPNVTAVQSGEGIQVNWDPIDTTGLQGYKVVASISDSTPAYPESGYAKWITDFDTKSAYFKPGSVYSSGDLEGMFRAGQKYYISVTAIYNSGKVAGNTVEVTMPGVLEEITTLERTPEVTVIQKDGSLEVNWSEISTVGLSGYKIVASKSNPNPVYSADGYAFWITDLSTHSKNLYPNTSYNNGDFGGMFLPGEAYYISVTAVYNDAKIPGNAIYMKMPN